MVQTELDVNEFLEANKGLVGMVLRQFYPSFKKLHIEPEDAFQEGLIGLYEAYCNYEEGIAAFSTFAVMCIRHAIIKSFQGANRKKRKSPQRKVSLDRILYWSDGIPVTFGDLYGADVDFTEQEVVEFHKILTPQENSVLEMMYEGVSRRKVAEMMGESPGRVSRILDGVARKYAFYSNDKLGLPENRTWRLRMIRGQST